MDDKTLFPDSVFESRTKTEITPSHYARLNGPGFQCDYTHCYIGIRLSKKYFFILNFINYIVYNKIISKKLIVPFFVEFNFGALLRTKEF